MIEKYVCIKEVLLKYSGKEDYNNYKSYFILYNIYDFVKEVNDVFPYTLETLDPFKSFHFNSEEMSEFFIKKSIIDREILINKILEDD
jgi:hypothetical protein